jgi:predicted DNA-binding protein with PD1-like motif
MAVRALDKAKVEFLNRYSNSELYTLIFTNYKDYPSELVKVADLEIDVRERVSQVSNALGITQAFTLKDFFQSVNQVRIEAVDAQVEVAAVEDTTGQEDAGAVLDYAGGGG